MDTEAAGYEAAKRGEGNKDKLRRFSEGWNVFHDSKYWEGIAAKIGAKVYGFSYRSRATFIFPNGELLEVTPGLLQMINRNTLLMKLEARRRARDVFKKRIQSIKLRYPKVWEIIGGR